MRKFRSVPFKGVVLILTLGLILAFQNCGKHKSRINILSGSSDSALGLHRREALSPLAFPETTALNSSYSLQAIFTSVSANQPVFLTSPNDASNRVFVVEKPGRIIAFQNTISPTATEFLNITSRVDSGNEQGLLGMAFDPTNAGEFYVYYTDKITRRSTISRFRVFDDNPLVADPASEEIVLQIAQPTHTNHKAGMLAFGPLDNFLYIAVGDGGAAGDPDNRALDTRQLLGKILRINVRGQVTYTIPSTNTFAASGNCPLNGSFGNAAGHDCGEIYAYGVRNPWRFSFDVVDSEQHLWVADVGQGRYEEVSVIKTPGQNLGWRNFEGFHTHPGNVIASQPFPPILEYARAGADPVGASVTGGYVYRGASLTGLIGQYIFGDYISKKVWALSQQSGVYSTQTLGILSSGITSFGLLPNKEIVAVTIGGGFYRINETVSLPPSFPTRLSQTGVFTDTANLVPQKGLIPYDLNSPLWSDNAEKKRWMALPNNSKITFSDRGNWVFPIGTVFIKHFELALSSTTTKRLETRALVNQVDGWHGYTYKWNAAQTDADLQGEGSTTFNYTVTNADGSTRNQNWYFPSRTDCLRCHTLGQGFALGPRTLQLNRDYKYPTGVIANQLRTWNHIDLFATQIRDPSEYERYHSLEESSAPIPKRARAYLAVNCAICHHPDGPAPTVIDLRFDTPRGAMNVLGMAPSGDDLSLSNAAIIRTGTKESSVLWERMRRTDINRMPPLATSLKDDKAIDVIGKWIDEGAD